MWQGAWWQYTKRQLIATSSKCLNRVQRTYALTPLYMVMESMSQAYQTILPIDSQIETLWRLDWNTFMTWKLVCHSFESVLLVHCFCKEYYIEAVTAYAGIFNQFSTNIFKCKVKRMNGGTHITNMVICLGIVT